MVDFFVENYEKMSDEALLRLAQADHADATLTLLERYRALVKYRARALSKEKEGAELDDLAQEGMIAVYAAIRAYDFSSASFSTFARLCIDRSILTALRKDYRKKQIPGSKLIPMDDAEPVALDGPEAIVIEREAFSQFANEIKSKLSELEYRILVAYLKGGNYDEIARDLALKSKTVDNAMFRIRQKLKPLTHNQQTC